MWLLIAPSALPIEEVTGRVGTGLDVTTDPEAALAVHVQTPRVERGLSLRPLVLVHLSPAAYGSSAGEVQPYRAIIHYDAD